MATVTETIYARNARYYSSADGFNIKKPRIPAHLFIAERDCAFAPETATGVVPLDLSATLGLDFPATTPLILARYGRIRRGETLRTRFTASGEIYYVIAGAGRTAWDSTSLAWEAGDVFCLPGGAAASHTATETDTVLWIVTNEPELAFERAEPPARGNSPIDPAHYPAEEIRRQLERIHQLPPEKTEPGKAVTLGNAKLDRDRTCTPSLTLAMNSLLPGESQRAHRHNAVAVTLVVQATRCYSLVAGRRVDWQRDTVMITPPTDAHSHHNEGDDLALFLIVQDGGLHYHCRTMGFSYT
jgi:gentisate 1,2-dioxygenase